MAHSHSHQSGGHSHGVKNYNRTFAVAVGLNIGFVIIEVVYGVLAGSLALLADAGHNLSDVLGLLMAWGASYLARREATRRRTYGLKKSTILAALFNALILLFAVGGIAWESLQRFASPAEIEGLTIIVVAMIGVIINGLTMLLFVADRKTDLNIRGAFVHMAADAGISLGVALAGGIILLTGQLWIDPMVSLVVAGVIFVGTWSLLRDSVELAIDAVPGSVDMTGVEDYLGSLPGVEGVHDLHVWGLSTTEVALTVHLVKPGGCEEDDALIRRTSSDLHEQFGISHTTIQLERAGGGCPCGNYEASAPADAENAAATRCVQPWS